MVETVTIIILLVAIAIASYAFLQPNVFRIERSIRIEAPPEQVYPLIVDFRRWRAWSPLEQLDTDLKRSYEGAPFGVGAIYAYEGGPKVGAGRMEIVEAVPFSKVLLRLDFRKPMVAHNRCEWVLTPEGAGTHVSWAMTGPRNFVSKAMGMVFNLDKIVGGMFADGLGRLKREAESQATQGN